MTTIGYFDIIDYDKFLSCYKTTLENKFNYYKNETNKTIYSEIFYQFRNIDCFVRLILVIIEFIFQSCFITR